MNILFLGRKTNKIDGGSIITMRNLMLLKNRNFNVFEILVDNKNVYRKILNIISGKPLGYHREVIEKIYFFLNNYNIDLVFIDHSLLGGYAKIISKNNIPIVFFFHNVEAIYYKEKMKIEGFHNFPMILWAKKNEKSAIQYSNYLITLTKRDSNNLKDIYGEQASLVLPTTFIDKYTGKSKLVEFNNYHLFVGSAFFANIEGLRWYINNILDNLNSRLLIIGKGFEFLNSEFKNRNFITLGFVDELEPYYLNADFVINPVFSGSGMKTKTIEAFMYGKTIIGTHEAFIGIEEDLKDIAFIADDKTLFMNNINKVLSNLEFYKHNTLSRDLFIKNFSIRTSINKFNKILKAINEEK